MDRYESEIRELEFEVLTLKKDKEEGYKMIREYQDREALNAHKT